ncbi:hypothetical protein BVV10_17465 [Xanthomonas oryzae pv. oryzae]|nr:hypothetical protein BVV16_17430 [Xanthomonas oryzae pv. oryzae]AUI95200.1 hypothetical protein BVV17_17460 [Xanthomonas oryzae pv. oryzae]AUI98872.1 hypothetical protein BVV18_17455 [Xanthomonas oryzae pv. oryzae]AUJ02551.1 hypothetical protein BVV10_17465 [Xanthomonas oryzae pv. oryzae]AUJ06217.1 hypothetical protein BVV19_17490 [Xanthomonas oryzae pv. oryzae]
MVSEGFDFELSGRLTQGWNATFGASRYTVRDDSGTSINTQLPRTTIKLFSSYTPQGAWSDLAVGGGVNWQNRSCYVDPVYGTFQQSAYARVSAFARYRLSPVAAVFGAAQRRSSARQALLRAVQRWLRRMGRIA